MSVTGDNPPQLDKGLQGEVLILCHSPRCFRAKHGSMHVSTHSIIHLPSHPKPKDQVQFNMIKWTPCSWLSTPTLSSSPAHSSGLRALTLRSSQELFALGSIQRAIKRNLKKGILSSQISKLGLPFDRAKGPLKKS